VCGDIVKEKTRAVFSKEARHSSTQPSSETAEKAESGSTSFGGLSSTRSLSQLLFLVGHIASSFPLLWFTKISVKQIIHIELCEAEFKRKKVELEKGNNLSIDVLMPLIAKNGETEAKHDANKEGDDLELIGGTSEDDFSEAIALVRYYTPSSQGD
jgi:condensin complex subunit 1